MYFKPHNAQQAVINLNASGECSYTDRPFPTPEDPTLPAPCGQHSPAEAAHRPVINQETMTSEEEDSQYSFEEIPENDNITRRKFIFVRR